jgi:hypothetical protein
MARVQREYWQKRNRWAGLKFWAEFMITAVLAFGVALIPVWVAIKNIP